MDLDPNVLPFSAKSGQKSGADFPEFDGPVFPGVWFWAVMALGSIVGSVGLGFLIVWVLP